jgi:hypothetical protein
MGTTVCGSWFVVECFSHHAVEKTNIDNQLACESALSGCRHEGTVSERSGACPSIKTERGGKLSRLPHFQRLEAMRTLPGHCRRCGKRNANGLAYCDRCRQYHAEYRLRKRAERFNAPTEVVRELAQFRRELSRLRAMVKAMGSERRRAYKTGYRAGLKARRARFVRSAWVPPTMSRQELAEINHAYDHEPRTTND